MKPQHVCRFVTSDRYARYGILLYDRWCEVCGAAQSEVPVSPAPRQLPLTPTTRKERNQ